MSAEAHSKTKAYRRKTLSRAEQRERNRPPVEADMRRLERFGVTVPPKPLEPQYQEEHRKTIDALVREHLLAELNVEHPLDVLAAGRLLTGAGEAPEIGAARRRAGIALAAIRRHLFGAVHAQAMKLATTIETTGMMADATIERWAGLTKDQRTIWYRLHYEAMRRALARHGRHVEAVTISVAIDCRMPRPAQLEALRRGLDALMTAPRPTFSEVKKHANGAIVTPD